MRVLATGASGCRCRSVVAALPQADMSLVHALRAPAPPTGDVAALIGLRRKPWPAPARTRPNRRFALAVEDAAGAIRAGLWSDVVDAGLGLWSAVIPFSPGTVRAALRIARIGGAVRRVCCDLEVDSSTFRPATGWRPTIDPPDALRRAAAA